jgi:hypothetical protein
MTSSLKTKFKPYVKTINHKKFIVLEHPQTKRQIYKEKYSSEKYKKSIINFKHHKDINGGKFFYITNATNGHLTIEREWTYKKSPPASINYVVSAFYMKNGKILKEKKEEIVCSASRRLSSTRDYDTIKHIAEERMIHKLAFLKYYDYNATENVEDFAERNGYELTFSTKQYFG